MHARVFVKLRVKSRDELSTLPCCHDVTIDNGKSLGWSLNTFYVRCSDNLTSSLKKHTFYNWLINNILYLCVT